MTLTLCKKMLEGLNVCTNYEFDLLDHVGALAKTDGGRRTKGTTIPAPFRAQRAEV